MKVINDWLAGKQNFYVGAAIYKTLGKEATLKDLFAKGKTPIAEKLLLQELTKLAAAPAPKEVIVPVADEDATKMPESDEPVLKAIREEWLTPYKQMVYRRHQLDQYQGNTPEMIEKRKPIAFEILELEQQCIQLWKKRDFYSQTGKLPEQQDKQTEIPTDPLELGKFIETCKRNIRRNRQKMAEQPGKPLYAQLHQQYIQLYKLATGKDFEEVKDEGDK